LTHRIVSLAVLALTLAACGDQAAAPPPNAPRHVILISIDTLRADHVGAYGYPRATTPFLDSLAQEGVLFEQQMSNSNNTLSSHASILSGLVPMAHGTRDGGTDETRFPLASAVDTLAERLSDAGYTSAAFTAHPAWLGRAF
jgi:arylsulfatase A-like enzyme